MGAPAGTEFLTAGGQLADEVVQVFVVRVAAGFGAQMVSAAESQSGENRRETGAGKWKRAKFGGRQLLW